MAHFRPRGETETNTHRAYSLPKNTRSPMFSGSIGIGERERDPANVIFAPFVLGGLSEREPPPRPLPLSRDAWRMLCPPIPIDLTRLCGLACFWPLFSPSFSRAGTAARPGLLLQVEKLE
jgi:hypothetical protein